MLPGELGWGEFLAEGDEAAYAHARAFDAVFERRLEDARAFGRASNGLAADRPDLSAKGGLTPGQVFGCWSGLGTIAAFSVLQADALLLVFSSFLAAVFGLIILLRLGATIAVLLGRESPPAARAADDELPVITVLVALRDEDRVAGDLLSALATLDYPANKLDVKLLIEADDDKTLAALRNASPPATYEVIPVPPGEPRTKPKALNYGLAWARGEIVAVFDAEDRPDPMQLREAAAAFRRSDPHLAVVQAPLQIHNRSDGWLAGQFETEYGIHFRIWLPFLARLGLPLALGGSSNYFRRDVLVAAGGWDAWNVTEDADLGLRLARLGYKARMISLPTHEEAPARFQHWLNQRTRWMKGHFQTWLVLMRDPFGAASGMGWLRFASAQVTLGGSLLASIMHLPLMGWLTLGLFTPLVHLESWHAALFGLGYGSVLTAALASAWAFKASRSSGFTLLLLPLYWPLLSFAMIRALFELGSHPHRWAKTPHGVKRKPPQP